MEAERKTEIVTTDEKESKNIEKEKLGCLAKPVCVCTCLVAQLCLTLCDPIDCSPPGFLSLGILQARILELVAMPSSRGSSQPRDRT